MMHVGTIVAGNDSYSLFDEVPYSEYSRPDAIAYCCPYPRDPRWRDTYAGMRMPSNAAVIPPLGEIRYADGGTWPPQGKVSSHGYVIPTRADIRARECYAVYAECTGRWATRLNARRFRIARIGNDIATRHTRSARNARK